MSTHFDENFWTSRYLQGHTEWDAGSITIPIKQYLDQITDKNVNILIPGAGNGHEAAYAHKKGFKNVHILDISPVPLASFLKQFPEFPKEYAHQEDFFKHNGQYDLILEQTFFCALEPGQRPNYAQKMHDLLKPSGKLVGVLFEGDFGNQLPPFGGTKEEYLTYFKPLFKVLIMGPCYNSIPPRQGKELFFMVEKSR